MTKKYDTKISYGLLIFTFLIFFVPVILGTLKNGIENGFYVTIGILIPSYAFILHVFLKTTYIVENKTLKIKCGFLFNKNIPIDSIKGIKKTKNLISSPAPSFDRIEIKYGKFDAIIISPKDKVTFAKDLNLINPTIVNSIREN